jgi:DNA-binding response OmpR family regulator
MDTPALSAPLNVLVVEDNDDLREATVETLKALGHAVQGIDCAEAVDDEAASFRADLVVLDLNLPGEDGLSLAKRMRAANPDIGIIMLTARNQVRDITSGYSSGADIYLTKPTTFEELAAAIKALARRLQPRTATTQGLTIKHNTRQLHGPLSQVDLSQHEYQLLAAFAQARDHCLNTWQLIELTSKAAEATSKGALEVQIVRLRRKLEQAGAPSPTIKAIRGTGYQLCVALEIHKT